MKMKFEEMGDEQKLELAEMDAEDSEKKGRRSSILKPQKPRNPLSTLDFSESNPDTTLGRATRRVSFASSNFIKPFAADPEKNTIWDNTYEEEVNHTDSTKSSCDHGTKTCDFLNVTSIYSASADLNDQNELNISLPVIDCINIAPEKAQAIINATNTGESLISFARKLRSRSIEQNVTRGTTNFTFINKPVGDFPVIEGTVKENISMISAPKESRISCSSTTLSNNTMEMTACITDKENVNPLINDLSLVTPRRNHLGATKNATMYFVDEDIDCINIVNEGEDTQPANVPDFTGFNIIKGNDVNDKNVNATKYESVMELTGVVVDENTNDEKEELKESCLENPSINEQIDDVEMKSVYSYNSGNDVQLPIANERGKHEPHAVEHIVNQSKQKTIIFNETDVNMDFTNLKISEPIKETRKFSNQRKTEAGAESNINLKGKTDINNQSESDMEFTTTFPVKIHSNIKNNDTHLQRKKKTICFNNSGETMEFTNTYQSQDIMKRTVHFNNSESNMEFTATLVGKINIACNNTISQVDDMEITSVLSTEPIENKIIEIEKDTTGPACNVESASTSNELKCDMSFTQNLCTVDLGLNKPLTKNDKSVDVSCNSDDFKKIGQIATNIDNVTTSGPVESSNLYDVKEKTYTKSNTINNNSSNTINHQSVENDISVLSISKGINDIKRHSTDAIDEDATKKRRIEHTNLGYKLSSQISTDQSLDTVIKGKANLQTNTANNIVPSIASALETNLVTVQSSENTNLQTSIFSNSNILYSEPMKLKLKTSKFVSIPNLSANINLDRSLPLDHSSTPASSFHMNLSAMSSCTEDTQQLIHATFSKPETLKILNRDVEGSFNTADKAEFASMLEENQQNFSKMSIESSRSDVIICDNFMKTNDITKSTKLPLLNPSAAEQLGNDFMKIINETVKNEKSCFLADITPLALVPEEFDQSGLAKSPNLSNVDVKTVEDDSLKNTSSSNSSDVGNYTLRSQMVLTNISKYLLSYEPMVHQRNKNLVKLNKEMKENYRQIKQLCNITKVNIVDLEERHKQDMEKNSSSISEVVASTDEDSGTPATLKLIAPKTIRERIRELAQKTEKYWEFVKIEEDYCYFHTLFGTLPFKVHFHPELGIVYSLITYTNLSGIAPPICWYQIKLFQQKLKQENLFSVLGEKFDIFTLLDYVYMSMYDVIKFHTEYANLVKKYEESHHFRMNSDCSITFEILNIKSIIFWIITVKMPLNNITSISKEDITAVNKVGQRVNEEHIKIIAENTTKGLNFLRDFIENVNEYANRIGRRLRK